MQGGIIVTRYLALLAFAGLLSLGSTVRADTQLLFSGYPTEYTPGTPFSFAVQFGGNPGPQSLLAYSVAMSFETADPTQLLVEVSKPGSLSTFVFGTNPSVLLGTTGIGSSTLSFNFDGSQSTDDGPVQPVDIVIGQNDILGVITVTPRLGLTGPITLSLNGDETSFDNGGEPVSFSVPQAVTAQQGEGSNASVPAPPALVLMGVGLAVMAIRRARVG